jgi:predicted amidohydrolase YtcJ
VIYQGLIEMMAELNQYGVTTIASVGGYWTQAGIESWTLAENRGKMTVRAFNSLYVYPDQDVTTQIPQLKSRLKRNESGRVQFTQAEIMVDGELPLMTAALFQPYQDYLLLPEDEQFGFEYWGNKNKLTQVTKQIGDSGFQLILMANGDRAVRWAIEAIEQVTLYNNVTQGQHRISGCFLVADDDWWKFSSANAMADFQLQPVTMSDKYTTLISDFIGSQRAKKLQPVRKVYDYGATVTLSSAFKRAPVDPIQKIHIALNLPKNESLYDLTTIVPMMTLHPAILLKQEKKTGSIAVGKYADLAILDENIFWMEPYDVQTAQVHATVLQGQFVYDPLGIYGDPIGVLGPKLAKRSGAWRKQGLMAAGQWIVFIWTGWVMWDFVM